jgi:hypothetical protein
MRLSKFVSLATLVFVSSLAHGSPICSGSETVYSCVGESDSTRARLVLCYNETIESHILIVNESMAHQVGTTQDGVGNVVYESDLVKLVVSSRDGGARFVDKENGSTVQCVSGSSLLAR